MFIRFGYESINFLLREVIRKSEDGYVPFGEVLCLPISGGRSVYFATMKYNRGLDDEIINGCIIPERSRNQKGEQ